MGKRQGEMTAANDVPTFGRRIEGCPYIVRPSAYALIRRGANELAVVRNAEGLFLPGGGIEAGEDAAQAILREAIEECGLLLRTGALKAPAIEIVYSSDENTCFEKQSAFLEADIVGFCSPTQDGHELVWMSIAQAIETLTPESHRWAVERLTEENA
jgi:8-oxo-dGTP diphosphatase